MVSDSWIASKTKISLFADERVKGSHVSIGTTKGVVHLRGKVDSEPRPPSKCSDRLLVELG